MNLKERIRNIHYGQAALIAVATSFFYLIALPLQTYLGNAQMFSYTVWDLIPEILLLFFPAVILIMLIEVVTEPLIGRVFMLAAILFGILGYIQVSFISAGLPLLNGEIWQFGRQTILNYCGKWLFILITVCVLCAYKWLIRYVNFASYVLLIMSVAFLLDGSGGIQKPTEKTKFDEEFCSPADMIKSIAFSTNRNVIVAVVDSAPADIVDQVVSAHTELQADFPGFVGFRNNIGMHEDTTRSMSAMVTGEYLDKKVGLGQHILNFWSEKSAVNSYFDAGYDLFVRYNVGDSYTNRRISFTKKTAPKEKYALLRYTDSAPFVTLKDILFYRLAFYRHKFGVILGAMAKGAALAKEEDFDREWQLYPQLEQAGISSNAQSRVFCLLHTTGLHLPILKDGQGNKLAKPADSRAAIQEYTPYVLKCLAGFIKYLKREGIYDNSLILIVADHGISYDPKYAMLWVKPIHGNRPYVSCSTPTSHCCISELLKQSVTNDLTYEQIEKTLHQDPRKLRIHQVSPEKWWQRGAAIDTYDISFDKDGKEIERTNLGAL